MTGQPKIVDGHIIVPDTPGLGIDIVEEAIAKYPSSGNIAIPDDRYDYQYIQARQGRALWLSEQETPPPEYRPGQIF
jgi:galactonate dehydratase